MKVTAESYHAAALEQIAVAQELFGDKHYVLAAYLAGLSVECMLRAYAYRINSSFDARHDLLLWYKRSSFDEIVPDGRQEGVNAAYSIVVSQWSNSQRYYSLDLLRAQWKGSGLDRSIRGDFVKELTRRLVNAASEIVTIGAAQWKNSSQKSRKP